MGFHDIEGDPEGAEFIRPGREGIVDPRWIANELRLGEKGYPEYDEAQFVILTEEPGYVARQYSFKDLEAFYGKHAFRNPSKMTHFTGSRIMAEGMLSKTSAELQELKDKLVSALASIPTFLTTGKTFSAGVMLLLLMSTDHEVSEFLRKVGLRYTSQEFREIYYAKFWRRATALFGNRFTKTFNCTESHERAMEAFTSWFKSKLE